MLCSSFECLGQKHSIEENWDRSIQLKKIESFTKVIQDPKKAFTDFLQKLTSGAEWAWPLRCGLEVGPVGTWGPDGRAERNRTWDWRIHV